MPTQARDAALWSCDYCGVEGLPSFQQAKLHEIDCRKRQRPAGPQASSPFAATPTAIQTQMAPQLYAPQQGSPSKVRRFLLLERGEGQGLELTDATACQSLEVFEANDEQVAEARAEPSAGESISLGQLGVRCIHCLPGTAYSTLYPQVTGNLSTCIQMLSDRHLSECAAAPPQVRQICDQTAARRQTDHEQRREPTEEEEHQQQALIDHCRYFAQNVGLVDKYPPKSGVVFGDSGYRPTMESQPEHHQQQPVTTRPQPAGGTPFQAPPPRAGQMMTDIAATPLARRIKHPDPDRDYPPGNFLPQTADRHYPPSGGEKEAYAAFQPHGSGLRGYYPPDSLQDARTPGIPHRPLEPPDSSQQPTPHGHHQDSPHGYPAPHSPYDMPPQDFPYFQDMNGSWVCRYCSHVHPQYRDQGAVWASPNHSPPHGQFIDQHLSICRSYNQAPPPGYYEGPSPHIPPYGYGHPPAQYGSQYAHAPPPGWGPPGHGSPFSSPDAAYPYPPPPSDHPSSMYAPPAMEREPVPQRASRPTSRVAASMLSETQDLEMLKAIDILVASDKQQFGVDSSEREARGSLVLAEDKLLLTDYFYHLMRQLRLCRFSEADRKTRGGKRENIKVGYGGLQCVHCSEAPNSRKFFWSNVDRLANSFAEIPGHVLKCRRCPVQIKNALMELKRRHPEQMARLPRGSQKVFFRRMWRRLHDEDPEPVGSATGGKAAAAGKTNDENLAPKSKSPRQTPVKKDDIQSEPCDSSDESTFVIERSTREAAKALAESSTRTSPPSPSSRVLLAIVEDKEWLSDMDCFIRHNLEVFCAIEEDVEIAREDRKYPVNVGQVGIRCVHCAVAKGDGAARGTAVAFPYSINGIYESVREFQRLHLESCPELPEATKTKLAGFKGSASLSSVLRKFYVLGAKALGMHDTPDGIRSGGESVPLGSSAASAFSFHESLRSAAKAGGEHAQVTSSSDSGFLQTAVTPLESRKRKTSTSSDADPTSESSKKSRDE